MDDQQSRELSRNCFNQPFDLGPNLITTIHICKKLLNYQKACLESTLLELIQSYSRVFFSGVKKLTLSNFRFEMDEFCKKIQPSILFNKVSRIH